MRVIGYTVGGHLVCRAIGSAAPLAKSDLVKNTAVAGVSPVQRRSRSLPESSARRRTARRMGTPDQEVCARGDRSTECVGSALISGLTRRSPVLVEPGRSANHEGPNTISSWAARKMLI